VISQRLPEARPILIDEFQPADPFRALPEIEVGNHEAGGTTVLGSQLVIVIVEGDQALPPVTSSIGRFVVYPPSQWAIR